jgi:hypothetical protein
MDRVFESTGSFSASPEPFGKEFLITGCFAFAFTGNGKRVVVQRNLDLFLLETRKLYNHRESVFVLINIDRGIPTT